MEELFWGFVGFTTLVVLLWRTVSNRRKIEALETALAGLRASLARDWEQRETARQEVSTRLATLEAGQTPSSQASPVIDAPGSPPDRASAELDPPAEAPLPAEVTPTEASLDGALPVPAPPPPPRPRVNLEEWLGVKGAAVGGGVIACLAAVMFFQHAIDNEWISPTLRVVLGTLAGLVAIGIAQTRKMRSYAVTANALAGAGLVALYASFWASHALYDIVSKYPAGALMALVTAACVTLSIRHGSIQIALLGLVGGFATPLLLSSGSDKPIELFGYLLLLDLAFLYLAQRRDWPLLGALSLLATFLFQVLWLGTRMGPERLWLGVAILTVFGVLFALAGSKKDKEPSGLWTLTRAGAVLFPLMFGLYFAARSELNAQPGPVFTMLTLVTAGACWLAHREKRRLVALGAASGSLAVIATFLVMGDGPSDLLWGAGITTLLAAIHHGFAEWSARREELDDGALLPAALAAIGGVFVVLVAQFGDGYVPAESALGLAAVVLMGVIALRQASLLPGRAAPLSLAAGLGIGLAAAEGLSHDPSGPLPTLNTHLATVFGLGTALQFWALKAARADARRWAEHGAATFAVIALMGLVSAPSLGSQPATVMAFAILGVVALIALVATRVDAGGWYLAATVLGAFGHNLLVDSRGPARSEAEAVVLAIVILSFVIFTWWPVLTTARFRTSRWAWYGAALAGPMSFPPARHLWEKLLGDGMTGVLAVGFGAVAVGALVKAQSQWNKDDPVRNSVMAWLGAAALFFISLAIPLQLERSWWTIGWALEGVAVLALWKRIDHPGLKYLAMGLFGAVSVRLLLNPSVLEYYDRGSWRIVNWLTYTYLVPAAALVAGAALLRPLEETRARSWEKVLYSSPGRLSSVLGLLAVLVGFAWINLAVLDWFAEGYTLTVSLDRMPARDLSFSISWAVYAVMLLAVGMARRIKGLRYLSLALLIVTIGKVFLYDLGHLEDLYRVASLVGLALSLFLVSLAYQRFVFRRPDNAPRPERVTPEIPADTVTPAETEETP